LIAKRGPASGGADPPLLATEPFDEAYVTIA
jgi:hypothetical protein